MLVQASFLKHSFSNIPILNIFEKSVDLGGIKNWGIFLPHAERRDDFHSVHRILIHQHKNVALSLPFLGTAHHDGQDEFFKVVIKLLVSTIKHSDLDIR